MPLLLNLTSDINRLSVELEKNKLLIDKIDDFTSEKEVLSEESGLIEDEFNALVSETLGLIDLWKSEEYIRLDDGSGKLLSPSSLDKNISNAREDILDMIELRNNNINILESVGLLKDRLKEITETYKTELNQKNLKELQELSEIFDNIINSYFILELKKEHSEEILSSDLNYNADILKNKIKAFSNISVQNAFLDIYGRFLIAVKNNSLLDSQSPEFCRSLRNITSDISDLNNASVDFKEDYYSIIINSSEFDRKLEEAKRSIEFIALKKSEEYVKGSSLEFRNDILAIIEKEIELKRDYSDISTSDFNLSISEDSSINISAEDMYKMVILDNYDNELFIAENCRDPGFKENFSETFESFFSANFSSLERYSPEISEPITTISLEFKDNPPRCCAFGVCNNCSLKKEAYPVILIHGHNMNNANSPQRAMNDFTKLQQKLQKDSFINVGELNLNLYLSEDIKDLWGMSGNPVSVRSSYYYIIDYKLGSYRMDVQKSERIENYALRLKEIIDVVKFKTGAEKVDIIAHSMGGLVARQYISIFGTGDIDKIITINTPNEGISTNIQKFCSVLGSSKECDDMSEGSIFLNRLNSKSIPDNLYVIRSTGCKMGETTGDGIVTNESAYLKGAKNYLIEGKCTDALNTNLHTNVLDPELYPGTYNLIKDILKE